MTGAGGVPTVSIIVVTYNASDFVKRCFAALAERTHVSHELIVVDNLSDQALRDWLSDEHAAGRIDHLRLNDENLLWAPAANQGLAAAHPDSPYLLLLNPDTEALVDDWLEQLIARMNADEHTGIVGPEQVFFPVGPTFGGVDGHCLLMRREVYQATGGIDEEFPWWGGGMKLNAAAWAAGWRFAIVEEPVLVHYEGRSNAERDDPVAGVVPDYHALLRSVGLVPKDPGWLLSWHWRRVRRRRKRKRRVLRQRVHAVLGDGAG